MCFSASASFTASAVLIPLGLYSNHLATRHERPDYKPLALVPFFFGVQQLVEGLEWTAIDNGGLEPLGSIAAKGFLFFAYCFWMIWIPWSAWSISRSTDSKGLQRRLKWVAIVATVLGIGFYTPVLFQSDLAFSPRLKQRSHSLPQCQSAPLGTTSSTPNRLVNWSIGASLFCRWWPSVTRL